ncbi:MAG: 4Fe-4S dicluster domain-containing protein [Bacteroidales bacterium]|nr:4Fe-4S dicluster domain-containing protein [Bacteroidales bacterium]
MDRTLFNKLTEVEPDALRCMACGSCSATCTAAGYTGMSVRKVLLNLQRGKNEEVRKMLSACMLCGKCTMACPRGINTRSIILNISKLW